MESSVWHPAPASYSNRPKTKLCIRYTVVLVGVRRSRTVPLTPFLSADSRITVLRAKWMMRHNLPGTPVRPSMWYFCMSDTVHQSARKRSVLSRMSHHQDPSYNTNYEHLFFGARRRPGYKCLLGQIVESTQANDLDHTSIHQL
jgi:hypothetical protein